MNSYDSLYGNYRTRTFCDIFPSSEEFYNEIEYSGITIPVLTDEDYTTLYLLLYSKYGNSHIASSDETQFKYNVIRILYTDGPLWKQKRNIHDRLVGLDINSDEVMLSGSNISNFALNPADNSKGTQDTTELSFINQQTVTKTKKNVINALAALNLELEKDYTDILLNKFKPLFLTVVNPELELWYETDTEE